MQHGPETPYEYACTPHLLPKLPESSGGGCAFSPELPPPPMCPRPTLEACAECDCSPACSPVCVSAAAISFARTSPPPASGVRGAARSQQWLPQGEPVVKKRSSTPSAGQQVGARRVVARTGGSVVSQHSETSAGSRPEGCSGHQIFVGPRRIGNAIATCVSSRHARGTNCRTSPCLGSPLMNCPKLGPLQLQACSAPPPSFPRQRERIPPGCAKATNWVATCVEGGGVAN